MINVYRNYFDGSRSQLIKAVYRDAVYRRTPKTNKAFGGSVGGHRDVLTTTDNSEFNNYHTIQEIQPLALQVMETTGYDIYGCWANLNKSDHWLGPHKHDRDNIKHVAIYYAHIDDNETLDFEDTQIVLEEDMLITFDSNIIHSFKPAKRNKDKIVVSFELI